MKPITQSTLLMASLVAANGSASASGSHGQLSRQASTSTPIDNCFEAITHSLNRCSNQIVDLQACNESQSLAVTSCLGDAAEQQKPQHCLNTFNSLLSPQEGCKSGEHLEEVIDSFQHFKNPLNNSTLPAACEKGSTDWDCLVEVIDLFACASNAEESTDFIDSKELASSQCDELEQALNQSSEPSSSPSIAPSSSPISFEEPLQKIQNCQLALKSMVFSCFRTMVDYCSQPDGACLDAQNHYFDACEVEKPDCTHSTRFPTPAPTTPAPNSWPFRPTPPAIWLPPTEPPQQGGYKPSSRPSEFEVTKKQFIIGMVTIAGGVALVAVAVRACDNHQNMRQTIPEEAGAHQNRRLALVNTLPDYASLPEYAGSRIVASDKDDVTFTSIADEPTGQWVIAGKHIYLDESLRGWISQPDFEIRDMHSRERFKFYNAEQVQTALNSDNPILSGRARDIIEGKSIPESRLLESPEAENNDSHNEASYLVPLKLPKNPNGIVMPLIVEDADEEAMENGSLESIDLNESGDDAHPSNAIEMVDLADRSSRSALAS